MGRKLRCKFCGTYTEKEKIIKSNSYNYCSKKCRQDHTREINRIKKEKELAKIKTRKEKKVAKKKNSASYLIKQADILFSKFIRLRDSLKTTGNFEECICITCGDRVEFKKIQCGHFASRRFYQTRWLEKNAHGQCFKCNCGLGGEQYKHGQKIDKMYGEGTAEQIMNLARSMEKLDKEEVKQTIENLKIRLKEYE